MLVFSQMTNANPSILFCPSPERMNEDWLAPSPIPEASVASAQACRGGSLLISLMGRSPALLLSLPDNGMEPSTKHTVRHIRAAGDHPFQLQEGRESAFYQVSLAV